MNQKGDLGGKQAKISGFAKPHIPTSEVILDRIKVRKGPLEGQVSSANFETRKCRRESASEVDVGPTLTRNKSHIPLESHERNSTQGRGKLQKHYETRGNDVATCAGGEEEYGKEGECPFTSQVTLDITANLAETVILDCRRKDLPPYESMIVHALQAINDSSGSLSRCIYEFMERYNTEVKSSR